jgi:hypothetical protein
MAMNPKDLKKDFAKTQGILKGITLSAIGWNATILDASILARPMAYAYVWDEATNFVWMMAVDREDFHAATEIGKSAPDIERQAYVDMLANMITGAATGAAQTTISEEWEHALGSMITLYASVSRTYETSNMKEIGGHFIVMQYNGSSPSRKVIRPVFYHTNDNNPIPPEILRQIIEQVEERDRMRHPDWFE